MKLTVHAPSIDAAMPTLLRRGTLLLALAAAGTDASAQALQDYRCLIERVATAGTPPNKSLEFQAQNYVGKEFTVERRTGLMAGVLKNSYLTKPQVIDLGTNDNSYKVVTTLRREEGAGRGSNVYTLVVNEYVKPPRKPFVFLENDSLYFGTCVHF